MRTIVLSTCRSITLLAVLAATHTSPALSSQQPRTGSAEAAASSEQAGHPVADPAASLTETQGDSLLAVGRYIAAIHAFEAVEPKTPQLYNKLGVSCEHMRMNDAAKLNFEKAIALKPDYAEVYNNLGTLAHTEGDYKHAEKLYKRSIHLDPHNPDTEKNLGTLYYARHKFRKGDEAYRRAHDIDKDIFSRSPRAPVQASSDPKDSADLHYHLAKTYAKAGSDQLALDFLRKAVNEGFKDRKRLMSEQEFAGLWNTPAFMKIVEDLRTN